MVGNAQEKQQLHKIGHAVFMHAQGKKAEEEQACCQSQCVGEYEQRGE